MNYPAWKRIAPDVYVFVQYGVERANSGLIICDRCAVLVDTVINKATADKLIGRITETTDKPVRYIINTHSDTDHVCTNHLFPDAMAICSSGCLEEMKGKGEKAIEEDQALLPDFDFEGSKYTFPDMVFTKEFSLFPTGREIRAIDMGPGHTASDTIVYLPAEKVVFCGDLVLQGLPPNTLGGSMENYLKSLEFLIELDAETYVTGHGPVGGKDLVRDFLEYTTLVREEAYKCYSRSLSCEEACGTIRVGRFAKTRSLTGPVNLLFSVARAYAEFRGEKPCSPIEIDWDVDMSQLGDGDGEAR